jgi:hypothetical protein
MKSERKELYSRKISAGKRTYFIDIKETVEGKLYLVISESRLNQTGSYEHDRVMIFEEDIEPFFSELNNALKFLKKDTKAYPVKAYPVEEIRKKYTKAYEKWSEEEDKNLMAEYSRGKNINELAEDFQRKPGAIRSRLQKLGLL